MYLCVALIRADGFGTPYFRHSMVSGVVVSLLGPQRRSFGGVSGGV